MELSSLIAQNIEDDPQKLVNLQLFLDNINSGSGLGGTNYVFVRGNGTPEENAAELQAAYDLAKTKPRYLGSRDTMTSYNYYKGQTYEDDALSEYYYYRVLEDFVGAHDSNLTKVELITKEEAKSTRTTVVVAPGEYTFGSSSFEANATGVNIVSLTGNSDVYIDGITVSAEYVYLKGIDCKTYVFGVMDNLYNLVCENCIGLGEHSFGYDVGSIVNGTFINCIGGAMSFGGYGEAAGTFINCTGRGNSFGGGGGTAAGTFINCTGRGNSFGGGGIITLTARLYYCRLTSGTFETPEAGGKLVLCIDGTDSVVTTA